MPAFCSKLSQEIYRKRGVKYYLQLCVFLTAFAVADDELFSAEELAGLTGKELSDEPTEETAEELADEVVIELSRDGKFVDDYHDKLVKIIAADRDTKVKSFSLKFSNKTIKVIKIVGVDRRGLPPAHVDFMFRLLTEDGNILTIPIENDPKKKVSPAMGFFNEQKGYLAHKTRNDSLAENDRLPTVELIDIQEGEYHITENYFDLKDDSHLVRPLSINEFVEKRAGWLGLPEKQLILINQFSAHFVDYSRVGGLDTRNIVFVKDKDKGTWKVKFVPANDVIRLAEGTHDDTPFDHLRFDKQLANDPKLRRAQISEGSYGQKLVRIEELLDKIVKSSRMTIVVSRGVGFLSKFCHQSKDEPASDSSSSSHGVQTDFDF